MPNSRLQILCTVSSGELGLSPEASGGASLSSVFQVEGNQVNLESLCEAAASGLSFTMASLGPEEKKKKKDGPGMSSQAGTKAFCRHTGV